MEKTKKERLFEVMEALGLTDYRVYTDVPEITKNMIVKLRNGETKEASSKILEPFCKYYKEVNPAYLLVGQGAMFNGEVVLSENSGNATTYNDNRSIVMRIKILIEKNGGNPAKFSKILGYNQSNLSKILRGERDVPANLINTICEKLNVRYNWLVLDDGEMLNGEVVQSGTENVQNIGNTNSGMNSGNTTTHNDNITYYNNCGDTNEKDKQENTNINLTLEHTKGAVPFYGDLPVSAGQNDLAQILGGMEPTGWINLPGMPSSIGAFPVIGCSMEPDIKAGDFISIAQLERWEAIDPDKIYMVITHDDRMIKHLAIDEDDNGVLWCISPNYPKFKIYKSEIVSIYRVTFHGRFT